MATYLLTWNPAKWPWKDMQECIDEVAEKGFCERGWSTGVTKRIEPGDRIFLMKVGDEPKGIIASGRATSGFYESEHWGDATKTALYVKVRFDTIMEPDQVFPLALLETGIYDNTNWTPQASGMIIQDDVADQLEKDWMTFLEQQGRVRRS